MGLASRKPPLPAPTEDPSSMDNETDLATDLTERTHHTIPDDGSPITIAHRGGRLSESSRDAQHHLLIEYFEGSKSGDKKRKKPSVRVKVTPSSARRSQSSSDAVHITGIGKDRRPSYTRRISLGSKNETLDRHPDGTEMSRSSGSNTSGRPPVEVEVLDPSDVSRHSRDLRYLEHSSDISSMPPDSLLETGAAATGAAGLAAVAGEHALHRKRSRSLERHERIDTTHLDAPGSSRTRSLSRERITQKVMEKLAGKSLGTSSRKSRTVEYEPHTKPSKERRHRSSRSQQIDEGHTPGSSQLSSNLTPSQTSYRSGNSKVSLNNPRLLEMVEDTVKRLILPELHQMRKEQKTSRNLHELDESRRTSAVDRDSYFTDVNRSVSKSSSTPNIRGKPKVVLSRYDDESGELLTRDESERVKERRRSSRDESGKSRRRSSRTDSAEEETKKRRSSHKGRDVAAGAIAGGILTAAALKHHDSHDKDRRRRSHGQESRSRSDSITDSMEHAHRVRFGEESGSDPLYRDEPLASDMTESVERRHHERDGRAAEYSEESYGNIPRPRGHYDDYSSERLEDPALVHQTERKHIIRMPFGGNGTESDITRASILSAETERPHSLSEDGTVEPPVREVSRGIAGDDSIRSPSLQHRASVPDNYTVEAYDSTHENDRSTPRNWKDTALIGAAAGLGGAVLGDRLAHRHSRDGVKSERHDRDEHAKSPSYKTSTRHDAIEPLIPFDPAIRSPASTIRDHSHGAGVSTYESERKSPLSPDVDSFAARSARMQDRRADTQDLEDDGSINEGVRRAERRHHAEEGVLALAGLAGAAGIAEAAHHSRSASATTSGHDSAERDIQHIAKKQHYAHHPAGVESDVASLVDPSNLSSQESFGREANRSSDELLHESITRPHHESPDAHEIETVQAMPIGPKGLSLDRRTSAEERRFSPRSGDYESYRERRSTRDSTPIQLSSSGVPDLERPMPEIGHHLESPTDRRSSRSLDQESHDSHERHLEEVAAVPLAAGAIALGAREMEKRRASETHGSTRREDLKESGVSRDTEGQGYSSPESGRVNVDKAQLVSEQPAHSKSFEERRHSETTERKSPGRDAAVLTGAAAGGAAFIAAAAALKRHKSSSPQSDDTVPESYHEHEVTSSRDKSLGPGNVAATGHSIESPVEYEQVNNNPRVPQNDEGYDSGAYARSVGTPRARKLSPRQRYEDITEYTEGSPRHDPFLDTKRVSGLSADSQGGQANFYEGATGRGMDKIQSQDIVALMDHLTVRDGQRNARDTEILVTLVRSAAEMRQNLDELKQFISNQDQMIMKNTDRNGELTTQKVLRGMPIHAMKNAQQSPRSVYETEAVPDKRQNVFKRALKGLSGKSSNDIGRIEELLMQLLDDVEVLKGVQQTQVRAASWSGPEATPPGSRDAHLSSYEALRAGIDSAGYDPEGLPGTGSTPGQSQTKFSPPAKQTFHSGYDGRRDSINRVSTVVEGDEEDEDEFTREEQLTPKPSDAYRYGSPNVDARRNGLMFTDTPPIQAQRQSLEVDDLPEKQRKHASNGSSIMSANPKVSRWSKTTTSSIPEGYDSRRQSQEQRPLSQDVLSHRSSNLEDFEDDGYSMESRGSPRSHRSSEHYRRPMTGDRSLQSYNSDLTRSASPLIPSETSSADHRGSGKHLDLPDEDEHQIDDPKYQAVRNSLLLEHPQPRQGPTHRHQSNLESQVQDYRHSAASLTDSDLSQRTVESDLDPTQWGSAPALSLSRTHKMGRINTQNVSAPSSNSSPRSTRAHVDDGPLFPIQKPEPPSSRRDDNRTYQRSQQAPRTFDKLYYSSPLGSGHLLEPIEEVRYSLETDSGRYTPDRDATPEPQPKAAARVLNPVRKITGPRPMIRNVSGGRVASN